MSGNVQRLFYEEQSFPQRRVRILVAIPPFLLSLLAIWQVGLGHPVGNRPMSNAGLIGWSIFLWLIYIRLVLVRLVTELTPTDLKVSMRGIWRKRRIAVADIKSAEVVRFNPFRDYGGYGMRTTRNGVAYIARGNEGVKLQFVKGAPMVIGSEKPQELAEAINRLKRAV